MIFNKEDVYTAFQSLKNYCDTENFKGWDPYDGLNSKVFQSTPLKNWDIARLIWIQSFKRSPINLRKLFLVPKEYNAKGIGLFLSGYCTLYNLVTNYNIKYLERDEILEKIHYLAELLLDLQNKNFSGACWGYNFDWQARRLFLFPANTPTVVATTFCASALFEAYEITQEKKYLDTALSSANFVLKDLNRTNCEGGFLLSYSPFSGNDTVYNASLLGAKLLSQCYHYTANQEYREVAQQVVNAACEGQSSDGSWVYGLLPVQSWVDSFHTGYNLDAISTYMRLCKDDSYKDCISKGLDFYLSNFFSTDGIPKYYHDKIYPIDIHCPGQLWVTLSSLNVYKENSLLSRKVIKWTLENMQDRRGYFYYQLKQGLSSKISYMRWSNAFMFNAMTKFLAEEYESHNSKSN